MRCPELEKRGGTHVVGEVELGQEAEERHHCGEGLLRGRLEPGMAAAGDM